ncbi:MAG: CHASE domain-containing protein [Magnetococcales bacterium]|nr:CHASE domain-containing protein [Magnetococcales bacterium]MBF0115241.1 CHASE domain-containing protein [Magnetococcales bacterium]
MKNAQTQQKIGRAGRGWSRVLILILLLCCAVPGAGVAQEAQKRTVSVALLRDFPPLSYLGGGGKPTGFAVELLELLAVQMKWSLRYHLVDNWQEAVQAIRDGVADLSPAVAITEQWEKEFLYSDSFLTTTVSCFVVGEQHQSSSCDHLTGRSITAIEQGAAFQQLSKRSDIRLLPAENLESAVQLLLNQQADLLIAPQPTVLQKLQELGLSRTIQRVGNPFLEIKRAILLAREHAEWLTPLNDAVAALQASGVFNDLVRRYYGTAPQESGATRGAPSRENRVLLALCLLLVLSAAYWLRDWKKHRLSDVEKGWLGAWNLSQSVVRQETAWIVLLISLVVTITYWYFSKVAQESRTHDRIEYVVEEARQAISKRMMEYEQVLRSGVALFNASRHGVDRQLWHDFVATLQIDTYWPGIQGIGYAHMIAPADLPKHLEIIRRQGFPHYTVRPAGEREQYSSIIYLEPFRDRNLRAFGYDMFSEVVRHEAMVQARDTGNGALSGPVKLVQETSTDVQVGFLMYLPVYQPGVSLETVQERREALLGFVYSPFRTKDLLRGILGHGIPDMDFELFDGPESREESRLYSSLGNPSASETRPPSLYNVSRPITLLGRVWMVHFHSRPEFEQKLSSNQPGLVLALGIFIDLLLFTFLRSLAQRQAQVQREGNRISRELQQSEVRYQRLVENIHDVIFQTDQHGHWQFLNPAWVTVSGYSVEEALHHSFLEYAHPDHHKRLIKQFSDLLAGRVSYFRDEVLGVRRDGSHVWVEVYTGAQWDEQGQVIGSFGTLRDISARRQAEEAAHAARLAAETANRAKSEFLANMSHELRTPLNSMLILSKLLANDATLNAEQQDSAQVIHDSGSDLLRLINDILDLSKVEAGRMDLAAAPMCCRMLLDSLQKQFRPQAFARRLQWSQSLDKNLPEQLVTDALKVEQILRNLLGNAFKFTERGGIHLAIERPAAGQRFVQETLTSENCIAFQVKDSGIGIPEEKFALIFESFQQVEGATSRKYGGTGLGLTIARRFAALLGGEIEVKSRVGEGSQFTLFLPLEFPFPDKIVTLTHDPDAVLALEVESDFRHAGAQILIVDDDARNRFALRKGLEGRTKALFFAADGEEALHALQANPEINLVLMDVMMPRMDGYQTMQTMRQEVRYARLPIIALTAKAMPGDRERCLQAGANAYLAKPVQLQGLYAVLRAWLPAAEMHPTDWAVAEQHPAAASGLLAPQGDAAEQTPLAGGDTVVVVVGEDIRRNFSLARTLQQRVAKVQIASNVPHLIRLLQEQANMDLLLVDYPLQSEALNWILAEMRQQEGKWYNTPVLVMTEKWDEESVRTAQTAGVTACLGCATDTEQLWMTLERILSPERSGIGPSQGGRALP